MTGDTRLSRRAFCGLVVVALALSFGATACASGTQATAKSPKRVRLSVMWWGGPERAKITEAMLELYTRKHPNVTFKTYWQENKGYFDKLTELVAAGQAPDLFQIDDNALTEYAKSSLALDLSRYVSSRRIDERAFPKSLADYGSVDGRPYAVASGENTPAMAYDKTVIQQLGVAEPQIDWSYEQLTTWATEITNLTSGRIHGTMTPIGNYKALWLWLRSQGKELYHGTEPGFTEDDVRRWFELWIEAGQRGATPPPDRAVGSNGGTTLARTPMLRNQVVTAFVWSNQLAELQSATDHQIGITAYPGDPKAQWARAALYWSVFRGSRHADAAADVINFLVNDVEAGKVQGTDRGVPANRQVRTAITGTLPAPMRASLAFEDAMAPRFGAAPPPPPKGHSQVTTLLVQAADGVLFDNVTPRQAAVQFVAQVRQILTG